MLSLKIDGKPVDLSEDFSITMNLKSPIFNEPGSYSYPFKLPPTARNKIALNFPHKVASVEDVYKEYKGVLSWNKNTLFSGTMKVDGSKYLNYDRITVLLWEQNKALLKKIESLEERIDKIEKRIK